MEVVRLVKPDRSISNRNIIISLFEKMMEQEDKKAYLTGRTEKVALLQSPEHSKSRFPGWSVIIDAAAHSNLGC